MSKDKTLSDLEKQFSNEEKDKAVAFGVSVVYRKASEIEMKPINWLWLSRFAKGKLSIIAGEPGLGKSQATINMAAHITTSRTWPDGAACEQGHVLILSAEDDASDTLVPRLKASEADLSRVHIIDAIRTPTVDGNQVLSQFSLARDLLALERLISDLGGVSAIFIDPISAYMGSNVDDHKNITVRSVLAPLAKLAERYNCAVIGVSHLNKNETQKALNRVIGSIGYIAAARAAFVVVRDKADKDRRLFLPLKNNIGNDETGLAFSIQEYALDNNIKTSRIVWGNETITQKADEIMSAVQDGEDKSALEEAKEFLLGLLTKCSLPAKEVLQFAEEDGIAEKTLRRAKKELRIEVHRVGFGKGSRSTWCLPIKE